MAMHTLSAGKSAFVGCNNQLRSRQDAVRVGRAAAVVRAQQEDQVTSETI